MSINRVFVIRRALEGQSVRGGIFAHSALLLLTDDKKYHVLEFMNDAQVYLYQVEVKVTADNGDHEIVEITRVPKKSAEWTKQKSGKAPVGSWTLEQAKNAMVESMKKGYSASTAEYCHTAQERTRERMGCK